MIHGLQFVLYVLALVMFALGAFRVQTSLDPVAAGLAILTVTFIL